MQIKLIIGAAISLALLLGGWYVKGVIADNATLKANAAQYQQALAGWEVSYDTVISEREQTYQILGQRDRDNQTLARRYQTINRRLNDEKTMDNCLGNPMPSDLADLLRHSAGRRQPADQQTEPARASPG